jgi:hypothetical protein
MKKRLISIAAALAIVAVCAAAIWWFTKPSWPEFTASTSKQPQVIVKVERDYAHHLGDLIEVEVFVHQPAGTTVDTKSLSIGGDFELAQSPAVSQKTLDDGTTVYRFGLAMQSFRVKKEQVMEGTIGYRVDEKRQDLAIEPLTLHTSNTYDGRKELMEGDNPRVPMLWYTLRHAVPLALSSLLFLVLTAVAFRHWLKTRVKEPVVDQALVRAGELVALIKSGTCTKAQYLELDGLVRDRFSIGPVPAPQLDAKLNNPVAVKFLKLNEPAIYAEDGISKEDRLALQAQAERVLTRWS